MRQTTDAYDAAKRAGAKPLFMLYIGTDKGLRCFGKQTPDVDHVGDEAFEWSARVLQFGDLRQSVSSDSDSVIQGLYEEEISSYTAQLDNADNYFSKIAGRETFLDGSVELLQGFDAPGFLHSDFLSLFSGTVSDFTLSKTTFSIIADQSITADTPDDPSVDTSEIYMLSAGGTTTTAAYEDIAYDDMEPVFYGESSWVLTIDISVETTTVPAILFAIQNDGNSRFEVGTDSAGLVYLKYTSDVSLASPTYSTLTSTVALDDGEEYRLSVDWDSDAGTVTFKDGKGQTDIIVLTLVLGFVDEFGTLGSGDGKFNAPYDCCLDSAGNIYVADLLNARVQKFDSDYTHLLTITYTSMELPAHVDTDSYDNLYVTGNDPSSGGVKTIFKFNSSGVFQSKFDSADCTSLDGIAIDSDDYIWVIGSGGTYGAVKYTPGGTATATIARGTATGEISTPAGLSIAPLNNIYITDSDTEKVLFFSESGSYISQWGTSGTSPGEFSGLYGVLAHDGFVFTTELGEDRVQKFQTYGTLIETFGSAGSGDGEFYNPRNLQATLTGEILVVDEGNDRIQKIASSFSPVIDYADTGTDDTIVIGEDLDGGITTAKFNDTFQLVNDTAGNTVFPDIISGIDIGVIDGTWSEVWTIDVYATEIVTETAADATETLVLTDSSTYDSETNAILPLPYGDLTENSDEGVWAPPLINSDDFVYCVAGWPVLSVTDGNAITVFVDGVETSSGWAFDESNDYQGLGNIAILTFTSDPDGDVTVHCKGKASDGVIITNPIDIVSDFVDYAAELLDISTWQKDLSSFAAAKNEAALAGYVGAGVIQSNNSLGYWIKAMLKPFLGSFRFSEEGLLQVFLQPTTETENVFDEILEYEAITVTASQNIDNVCGRILVNYAVSYGNIDKRYTNNSLTAYLRTSDMQQDSLNSQVWELDFDWCRKTANIETVQTVLLALYADPEYIVAYQGQDFKFVPVSILDQLSTTLSFLVDSNGDPIEDVVCSLREKTINMDTFTTTLSMQSLNFIDIAPAVGNQLQFGGIDVQFGGVNVSFGG